MFTGEISGKEFHGSLWLGGWGLSWCWYSEAQLSRLLLKDRDKKKKNRKTEIQTSALSIKCLSRSTMYQALLKSNSRLRTHASLARPFLDAINAVWCRSKKAVGPWIRQWSVPRVSLRVLYTESLLGWLHYKCIGGKAISYGQYMWPLWRHGGPRDFAFACETSVKRHIKRLTQRQVILWGPLGKAQGTVLSPLSSPQPWQNL